MAIPTATLETCTGEAHRNPYIDNCGVCVPFWGQVPVCAEGHKLRHSTGGRLFCPKCRRFYQFPAATDPVLDVEAR